GGTLRARGRRVLLTTLLIEEPERQHDQADDEPDLEDEEQHRQEQNGCELPKADAQDSDGSERKHGLHHKIQLKGTPTIRRTCREVSNAFTRITVRIESWKVAAGASPPARDPRRANASAAIR